MFAFVKVTFFSIFCIFLETRQQINYLRKSSTDQEATETVASCSFTNNVDK